MIPDGLFFDRLPLPIVFIDSTHGAARANDYGCALLGLSPDGPSPQDIVAALARTLGESEEGLTRLATAAAVGQPPSIAIAIGARAYRAEACPIEEEGLSGLMWLFHDITGTDTSQPGSANLPTLIKIALDRLDEGVLLLDRQDRIRVWNEAYIRMLDLPRKLFAPGAAVMPLIRVLAERGDYGPGDPEVLAALIAENVRLRMTARGERQMANGTIIDAEWITLSDGYFMFRLSDVTSERTASRFKDELIATVSHELRTPLTVVSGALGLLRGDGRQRTETEQAALLAVAHKNSDRLTRLVNDLLDVDKLQSGTLDFQFEATDLGPLLAASVEQNLPYSQELGVMIDLEIPDQPVIAEVDRDRLLQVMSNLLSNAAKFSSPGSRARVRLTPSATGARISVIDQGRGMSPEFRRRLFTRFAQENRIGVPGKAGTGLGLAICKSIVDRHGGAIHVETKVDVGTIFHIDLPFDQASAAET